MGDNDCHHHVEHIHVVEISDNIDIGISYNCDQNNRVQVTGIYLNKTDILNQHLLVSPHNYDCLDDFKSCINMLMIGNPDDSRNQIKDLQKRLNDAKVEIKRLNGELNVSRKRNAGHH